jgi:hypothetical protein
MSQVRLPSSHIDPPGVALTRAAPPDHVTTGLVDQENAINERPPPLSHAAQTESDSSMDSTRTFKTISEATRSHVRGEQKVSQHIREELDCMIAPHVHTRTATESATSVTQGAQHGISDGRLDLNLSPPMNATRLNVVTNRPLCSADPEPPNSGALYERDYASLDHNEMMQQSGHDSATCPSRCCGSAAVNRSLSVDGQPRSASSRTISTQHHATSASVETAATLSDYCVGEPAAMAHSLEQHDSENDIMIFPMDTEGPWVVTAIVGSLAEARRLSTSTQMWPISCTPHENLTILSIRPLNLQQWLILAKLSCPHELNSVSPTRLEEPADPPMSTRRGKRAFRNTDSSRDFGNVEYHVSTHNTMTKLRTNNTHGVPRKIRRVYYEPDGTGGPYIKRGDWEEDEDHELTRLVETATPWRSIFAKFPYRSEAAVRSRWYCKLKRLVS